MALVYPFYTPKPPRGFWTAERLRLMNRLKRQGYTDKILAERLGTSVESVRSRRARLRREAKPKATYHESLADAKAPRTKPDALSLDLLKTARGWLGDRLIYKGSQAFLDQVPVSLDDWMREAGRLRGKPFGNNPNWIYD